MKRKLLLLLLLIITARFQLSAKEDKEKKDTVLSEIVGGLKWRNIGPAYTSGRIADFAINPQNHNEYYVAAATGTFGKPQIVGQHSTRFLKTMEPIPWAVLQ